MAYTTTMIGFALGNLLIGSLVDRMGITFAMVLSAIGIAVGFAGASYVDSIFAFAFFQFIAGFFTAVGFGPLLADISQWFVNRRGMAVDSLVSGGCIVSGSTVKRSLLSNNVRIHSYSKIKDAVILPNVEIGRNCRLRRVIIDRDCKIPPGTVIGYDREQDAKQFYVSPNGIVLVSSEMLGKALSNVA